ncbi:MAG TPA: hypothetical protein VJR89_23180 [Polyangiales bacterium]|nr:hypothetical protein [Polyangiales bacterium]
MDGIDPLDTDTCVCVQLTACAEAEDKKGAGSKKKMLHNVSVRRRSLLIMFECTAVQRNF